jgi:hypothetical protein
VQQEKVAVIFMSDGYATYPEAQIEKMKVLMNKNT